MIDRLLPISVDPYTSLFFKIYALIILLSVSASVLLEEYALLGIPAFILLIFITVVDFRKTFYILLACIPLSVEVVLPNGFGTDLPTEPLIIGLMLVFLLYVARHGTSISKDFVTHPITLLLLLHVSWTLVSAITAEDQFVSIKFFLAKTWYITVFFFLVGHFIKKPIDFRPFFWALFLPLVIATIIILIKHSTYSFHFEYVNKTLHPFFRNHVDYGVMLALWVPFIIYARKWYRVGSIPRAVINVGLLVILIGIVFSFTRAAYVSLVLIPIGYFIFKNNIVKTAITVGSIMAILAIASLSINKNYLLFAPDFEKTVYHTGFEDHLSATVNLSDLSTMERFHRWIAGIKMSGEYPLSGFGPGTFFHFYKPYADSAFETYVSDNDDQSTVHNYFILILLEQGIMGLLVFLVLIITFFVKGQDVYNESKPEDRYWTATILTVMLVLMANIFMADLIETDAVGSLFFILIALLVSQDLYNKRRNRELESS